MHLSLKARTANYHVMSNTEDNVYVVLYRTSFLGEGGTVDPNTACPPTTHVQRRRDMARNFPSSQVT